MNADPACRGQVDDSLCRSRNLAMLAISGAGNIVNVALH